MASTRRSAFMFLRGEAVLLVAWKWREEPKQWQGAPETTTSFSITVISSVLDASRETLTTRTISCGCLRTRQRRKWVVILGASGSGVADPLIAQSHGRVIRRLWENGSRKTGRSNLYMSFPPHIKKGPLSGPFFSTTDTTPKLPALYDPEHSAALLQVHWVSCVRFPIGERLKGSH